MSDRILKLLPNSQLRHSYSVRPESIVIRLTPAALGARPVPFRMGFRIKTVASSLGGVDPVPIARVLSQPEIRVGRIGRGYESLRLLDQLDS